MSKQTDEKRELLKMKQGIIEESDLIQQDVHEEIEKPKGIKAFENFMYRNKWYAIVGVFMAFVLVFLIVQTVTREAADMTVLLVTSDSAKAPNVYQKVKDIELALEEYCPDFDGNGNVHVDVFHIDLTKSGGDPQYINANSTKLFGELQRGVGQLFICDKAILGEEEETETEAEDYFDTVFMDLGKATGTDRFLGTTSIKVKDTPFAKEAKWENSCPDVLGFSIRKTEEGLMGHSDDSIKRNEQAQQVLKNILNNNKVNPSEEK